MKIYLIAGHNGPGTGANGYIDEGTETIVLRDLIDSELCKLGVIPEVDKDKYKINEVVDWLKSEVSKDDVCVDIHFNAASESASGTEVFIPNEPSDKERELAGELSSSISEILGIRNRGVKFERDSARGKLAMLSNFDCHQVLIEVCFATNKEDAEKYNEKKYEIAAEIASILAK